jgi:hypothetical protein
MGCQETKFPLQTSEDSGGLPKNMWSMHSGVAS